MARLIAVLALFLAGCASVPDVATAPRPSADVVLDSSISQPHSGAGAVTFKRDSWLMHAYRLPLYVDGKKIATIGNGEVLTVYLPQGRRLVGVGKVNQDKPDSEAGVDVTEGKQTFVHLTLSAWGWGGWDIAQSSY